MLNSFDFCIPTRGIKVPAGPEWLHEIKYDGYRLRVERNGGRVRLITKGGYDWSKRFLGLSRRLGRYGEAVIPQERPGSSRCRTGRHGTVVSSRGCGEPHRRLALTGRWPDDAQEDVGPDDSPWSANLMPINAQIEVLSYQFSNI
jgi:hypothetical protein